MRSGAKTAIVSGVVVVAVGAVGYGLMAHSGSDDSSDGDAKSGPSATPVKTGPPSPTEVRTTAEKFLAAWSAGDPGKAAALTSDEHAASTALTGYRKDAHISKVTLTRKTASGDTVPFTASAEITYGTQHVPWTYDSSLTVVRDTHTGKAVVGWKPSVVYPKLGTGDTLKTDASGAPPLKVLDRNGTELTASAHPTLTGVLDDLRQRYGKKAGGKAGVELRIDRAKGSKSPDQTLKVLSTGTPGTLHTTLDSKLQAAAEQAVKEKKQAGVVALKPSTGEILAVANSPAQGFNLALDGSLAPGSTMKIVTSTMLIDKGLVSYGKSDPCPKYFTYGGWKFHNEDYEEIKNGTLAQGFAASCNNAFIRWAPKVSDSDLTSWARDVYGLGLNWQTGVTSFDGAVPVQHDAQKAASLMGQGGVRMDPLNMASVAATASTGTFHQPYIVSPSFDHRTLAKATRTMKAGTRDQLRKLMNLTATSGTAAKAMAGLTGDIGAKTGSAEVDGQKQPNGWLTAYRNDLAVAGVVPKGGHGGDSAGPMVASVLRAG